MSKEKSDQGSLELVERPRENSMPPYRYQQESQNLRSLSFGSSDDKKLDDEQKRKLRHALQNFSIL